MTEDKANLLVVQAKRNPNAIASERVALQPMKEHTSMHFVNVLTYHDLSYVRFAEDVQRSAAGK